MNKMTAEALKNDQELGTPLIKVHEIYLDHEFNCRGRISILDCLDLAKDIAVRGLQSPIQVRPLRESQRGVLPSEQSVIARGYKYKVIAGHRRLTAYKANEAELIPATVKDAYISIFDEHDLNAIENLQREELNFEQEAHAIRHYVIAGWARNDIANRVNKSPGWVQLRMILLNMPKEIQELAGQGYIRSTDMNEMNKFKEDRASLLRMAGELRDMRRSGVKGAMAKVKQREKQSSTKIRGKMELIELLTSLQKHCRQVDPEALVKARDIFSLQGNSAITRILAWAAGEISVGELHESLRDFFEMFAHEYLPPEYALTDNEIDTEVRV